MSETIDHADVTLVRGETLCIDVLLQYSTGEPVLASDIDITKLKSSALLQDGTRIPLTIKPLEEDGWYNLYSSADTRKFKGRNFLVNIGLTDAPVEEGFEGKLKLLSFNQTFYLINSATDLANDIYLITYYIDGVEYHREYYYVGETINSPSVDPREGYQWSGWTGEPSVMPDHDVTVNGTFTQITYKITYQVDGTYYNEQSYHFGDTVTPLPEPTAPSGKHFSGWSNVPSTMPSHNVTVTGQMLDNVWTVTYRVDGSQYGQQQQYHAGDTIVPPANPTKTGYTFSSWSGLPSVMPSHNVTVDAVFTINSYTVSYYINDDEFYDSQTYQYQQTITPLSAPPAREGYTWQGWSSLPATMPANNLRCDGTFLAEPMLAYRYAGSYAYVTGKGTVTTPDITIPRTVVHDGTTYKVLGIDDNAFKNDTTLRTVYFPDTESDPVAAHRSFGIGSSAFEGSSVKHLGAGNFYLECEGGAFRNSGLMELVTDSNRRIFLYGGSVFANCTALEEASLDGLRVERFNIVSPGVEVYTFAGCTSLSEIHIPSSFSRIDAHAFYDCSGLRSIYIPSSVRVFGVGCLSFSEPNSISRTIYIDAPGDDDLTLNSDSLSNNSDLTMSFGDTYCYMYDNSGLETPSMSNSNVTITHDAGTHTSDWADAESSYAEHYNYGATSLVIIGV